MTKIDLAKEDKKYFTAKVTPEVVEFPELSYLAIEGQGEPAGKAFTEAVQALYPFAYGIKGLSKKEGKDFGVSKLEGLWWVDAGKDVFDVPREKWHWKLLIRLPDFVTSETVEKARAEVMQKKKITLVKNVLFEKIKEGKCIQVLHVGPYSTEPETIAKIRQLMKEQDLVENGLHHEIYFSDPKKTAPEKMKTILRQPVKSSNQI